MRFSTLQRLCVEFSTALEVLSASQESAYHIDHVAVWKILFARAQDSSIHPCPPRNQLFFGLQLGLQLGALLHELVNRNAQALRCSI